MIRAGSSTAIAAAQRDPYAFLRTHVHNVPGWLEDYAALRTMDLLSWQEENNVRGPLLEIGVFYGRYLSLLLRSALRRGEAVLALDTFQYVAVDAVKTAVAPLVDPESIDWLSAPSVACSSRQLLDRLGAAPRFISIDGSHDCADVVWDLRMADDMLAPNGIVAVDDFLNPLTLGVNDGVHRFFADSRNLAPFAFTANKLFLSRSDRAAFYARIFEDAILADASEPRSETFRQNQKHGRHHVEQVLWGTPVLIAP